MKQLQAAWKNPKTTVAAIASAAAALLGAVAAQFDDDPMTHADWNTAIPLVIIAVGLFFGRDADTTSEQSGVQRS